MSQKTTKRMTARNLQELGGLMTWDLDQDEQAESDIVLEADVWGQSTAIDHVIMELAMSDLREKGFLRGDVAEDGDCSPGLSQATPSDVREGYYCGQFLAVNGLSYGAGTRGNWGIGENAV